MKKVITILACTFICGMQLSAQIPHQIQKRYDVLMRLNQKHKYRSAYRLKTEMRVDNTTQNTEVSRKYSYSAPQQYGYIGFDDGYKFIKASPDYIFDTTIQGTQTYIYKDLYSYNASWQRIKWQTLYYNPTTSNYEGDYMDSNYAYTSSGKIITRSGYYYDTPNSIWTPDYQDSVYYDASENSVLVISKNWNTATSSWENSYQWENEYNSQNNNTKTVVSTFNNGTWHPSQIYFHTYTSTGLPLIDSTLEFNPSSGIWSTSSLFKRYYIGTKIDSTIYTYFQNNYYTRNRLGYTNNNLSSLVTEFIDTSNYSIINSSYNLYY